MTNSLSQENLGKGYTLEDAIPESNHDYSANSAKKVSLSNNDSEVKSNEKKKPKIELFQRTDGGEKCIATFSTIKEAYEYAVAKRIMNQGWVKESLKRGTYPSLGKNSKKYPYTNEYRFSFIKQE